MGNVNRFGQPVGDDLGGWEPPSFPTAATLRGRTTEVEPLEWRRHGRQLFEVFDEADDSLWTYMPFGPFRDVSELEETVIDICGRPDWIPYAILVGGRPLGIASYLRIRPEEGVIEIGAIVLDPSLQNTTPATEALYLLIRNVFEMGFRRCEWKCDALNTASRRAGERLGFRYEGTFRQATHYKGRSRDTAWYSIVADEWDDLDSALRRWLDPANFTGDGAQRRSLAELRGSS